MYVIYMLSDWVEHWASEAGKILAGDAIHKSDKKMCQVIVLPTISHTILTFCEKVRMHRM